MCGSSIPVLFFSKITPAKQKIWIIYNIDHNFVVDLEIMSARSWYWLWRVWCRTFSDVHTDNGRTTIYKCKYPFVWHPVNGLNLNDNSRKLVRCNNNSHNNKYLPRKCYMTSNNCSLSCCLIVFVIRMESIIFALSHSQYIPDASDFLNWKQVYI